MTDPCAAFQFLLTWLPAGQEDPASPQALGGFSQASGLETSSASLLTLRRGLLDEAVLRPWQQAGQARGATLTLWLRGADGQPLAGYQLIRARPAANVPAGVPEGPGWLAVEEWQLACEGVEPLSVISGPSAPGSAGSPR